ncbi:cupredoxin domain-containing protein [Candidatus Roizmanbacteria bacterium]|nr:cupredoxin domain-containing protein [Candidatus Roizmanbacteria bacterium]
MNNKTLIGIVVAVLVILGAVVVMKSQQTTQVAPSQSQEATTTVSPEEATASPEITTENAMMEKEVKVNLTDSGFDPQEITVKVGTKVVWVNKTDQTGNVSSAKHPTHLVYPPLNLGDFEPGESVSLVFNEAGSYGYHDHLNPSQFGKVVVE